MLGRLDTHAGGAARFLSSSELWCARCAAVCLVHTRSVVAHILLGVGADTCVNAGFGWDEEEEECGFHSTVDCTLSASGYGAAEKERPMPMPSDGKRIDFAQWQDCHSCVAAGMPSRTPASLSTPQSRGFEEAIGLLFFVFSPGFGWCRIKQKCGGFASRSCVGLTPAEPANQEPDDVRKGSDVLASVSGEAPNFGTYTDCNACIGAGYGWCPIRRKCGGFANKVCGSGESYVASPAAEYTDCLSCVQGGFGWDPHRQLCGNFRNKDCSSENPDFTRFRTCELCVQVCTHGTHTPSRCPGSSGRRLFESFGPMLEARFRLSLCAGRLGLVPCAAKVWRVR